MDTIMPRNEGRTVAGTLTFPIKLRCSSVSGLLTDTGLEAGVARALRRAFATARTVLPTSIDDCITLHTPYLTNSVVTGDQAAMLLARIQRAIDTAAMDRRTRKDRVPNAAAGEISEPLEPGRYDRKHGAYVIDSYKGGDEAVEVISFEPDDIRNSVEVVKIVQGVVDDEIQYEMERLALKASPAHPLGLIYRVRDGEGATKWQVTITTGGPVENSTGFRFKSFVDEVYQGPTAKPMFKQVEVTPGPGSASAEVVIGANDSADIKTRYQKLKRDRLDTMLRRWPTPPNLTTKRFHEIVRANFEQTISDEVDQILAQGLTQAVQVRLSGKTLLVWLDSSADLRWKKAQLTPIPAWEARPKTKPKTGGDQPGGSADGDAHGSPGGKPGEHGLCPEDVRPDDHPPDDVEESLENLPFLGEPALQEIGDAGETLQKKMDALAAAVGGLNHCDYAGQFCYQVAVALRDQAVKTQSMAETATGENSPPRAARGNMGALDFAPGDSSIIQAIRRLGNAVFDLGELVLYVADTFESDTYRCSIHGIWRGLGISWAIRFLEAVVPVVKEAVGELFIGACRSMLLQLLGTSRQEIVKRQRAMPRYAVLFERWIVPMITDISELQTMRSRLQSDKYEKLAEKAAPFLPVGTASGAAWVAASGGLIVALKGNAFTQDEGALYGIVEDQGVTKVRDGKGRLWSNDDLEQAIALNGQIAQGVDPLVQQLIDTPEAKQRFKDTRSVQEELDALLVEMVLNNREMTGNATSDSSFAFTSSPIEEDIPTASISGGKYSLQGIHKIAHEHIGDAFRNSSYYAAGLDDLFDSELGKKSLEGFALMTGIVLVSVLVPGGAMIALAAGGAMAAHELDKAYEQRRLYRALIDPELVLKHADVEAGIFAAWVGAVIAVIPEVGPATKALVASGKAVVKGEVKAALQTAGKAVATRVAKELAEYAAKDILEAFVKETVVNLVMDQIMQRALEPFIDHVRHEASVTHEKSASAPTTQEDEPEDSEEQEFIQMIRGFEVH